MNRRLKLAAREFTETFTRPFRPRFSTFDLIVFCATVAAFRDPNGGLWLATVLFFGGAVLSASIAAKGAAS